MQAHQHWRRSRPQDDMHVEHLKRATHANADMPQHHTWAHPHLKMRGRRRGRGRHGGLAAGAGNLNSSSVVAGEKQVGKLGWQPTVGNWYSTCCFYNLHNCQQDVFMIAQLWESETGKMTTVTRIPAFTSPKPAEFAPPTAKPCDSGPFSDWNAPIHALVYRKPV